MTLLLKDDYSYKRDKWNSKSEYIFACIGYAVGLGNIWRFPYLLYKNGGGAFLVPYTICLIFGGLPMFLLESIGQYTSSGGIAVWNKICPLFKGIGYAAAVISFWSNSYYIVVLAWSNFYLWNSLTFGELPWSTCGNYWNTGRCIPSNSFGSNINSNKTTASVNEFWEYRVLQRTESIENIGNIRWELVISLLATWIIIYFCIWKGIKWTGKVVYVTSTMPYFILITLVMRGVTLDGAWDGIKYLIIPNWSLLTHSEIWVDAVSQVFFSYGLGVGMVIGFGSYNHFKNNCFKDAFFLVCMNEGTSMISAIAIFSILGFMAKTTGKGISEVTDSGPGLIFIAYPNAMSQLPFSTFWNIAFFIMILFIGLDSQFCCVEAFIIAVTDLSPKLIKSNQEIFVLLVCLVNFFIGTLCLSEGGVYIFTIFNMYAVSGWSFLSLIFFECIAVSWCYGINRFCGNIQEMTGIRLGHFWKICWVFTTPFLCLSVAIFSLFNYEKLTYGDYVYPWWGDFIGWMLTLSSAILIPLYAIYRFFSNKNELKDILSPVNSANQSKPFLTIQDEL